MKTDVTLVALQCTENRYTVESQFRGGIDFKKLRTDGKLHNVSESASYFDEAAVIERRKCKKYLFPESTPNGKAAHEWLDSLPTRASLIVVHSTEWDGGWPD